MPTPVTLAAVAFAVSFTAAAAVAQPTYPTRPIRMIMPFAPGGSADNLGRILQPGLADALGQQIVIENRPGASSVIGVDLTAKSAPDGYTIVLITTTHTVNPSLMKKLPFDPVKDFAGISLVVSQPNLLAVHPSLPVKSVKDLVALAKAKPGAITFASGGNGSSPHLSGELLNLVAGIKLIHVPYKGSGPGVTDLLGGHVHLMFAGPLAFVPHIKSGRLRPLAIADTRRSPLVPDVPTMAEAGFAGVETGTWYALLAPAKTPRPIIDTLHRAVAATLKQPDIRGRMDAQGVDIVASTPQELDRHLQAEVDKWAKLVKAANITVN